METIFIQIASYRDPELIPTVLDCIEKSSNPQRLYFGICAQYDPLEDNLEDLLFVHSNIKLKFINYTQAKGTCWARSVAQSLYSGETYSLQIDSHMRFTKDWDIKLIDIWKSLNDEKGILTAYPGKYYPDEPESEWPDEPPTVCGVYRVHKNQFKQRGYFFREDEDRVLNGVALSAAYIFGSGKLVTDVPYDPNLYFEGEEMSLALRLYTSGYNIYHPNKVILFHYWLRHGQPRHWTDSKDWGEYQKTAIKRINSLIGLDDDDLGIYSLGNVRTLEDYKNYSGIDVVNGGIHTSRLESLEPPLDYSQGKWVYPSDTKRVKLKLKWDTIDLPNSEDITYWYVNIVDQDNINIHSFWFSRHENKNILTLKKRTAKIEFDNIEEISTPCDFTIQPYSEKDKWLKIYKFPIK